MLTKANDAIVVRNMSLLTSDLLFYSLVDTPPGTSDEHLTVVKALKNVSPDGAVIVTTPQDIALNTIRKEINFCKKMNLRIIGIISNMSGYVCPCCNVSHP